jgi:glycosyltransferase involved in cell wall biosynthesis
MVVVASYQRKKNMIGLAKALGALRERGGGELIVDWFGAVPKDAAPLAEVRQFVDERGPHDMLRFHPPKVEIEKEYQDADAVGLFSEYEGLPNVVCEGMASGRPIIMSDVCDARHLVDDGWSGFLCNPYDPASIADALLRFTALSVEERDRMGRAARRKAEVLFAPEQIVGQYEEVLAGALAAAS